MMDRYCSDMGKKAHRLRYELDQKGVALRLHMGIRSADALCGQWLKLSRKAPESAPLCKACERMANRVKEVSKP